MSVPEDKNSSIPNSAIPVAAESVHAITAKLPATPNLCYFLRLLIRLRWIAASGTLAVIATFQLLKWPFQYTQLYLLASAILVYNAGFYLYTRKHGGADPLADETEGRHGANRINALLQINLDTVALFWLLHSSGGLENPCVLFFLFHVVIAGILLAPRLVIAQTACQSLLVFLLGVLEHTGVLPHHHASVVLGDHELLDSWTFVLGLPAMISLTMVFLSIFTLVIMRARRRRQGQILALSEVLRQKNEELVRVDEGRRRLLAVASHDLKSPIAAVAGYLMTMRGGYIGDLSERQAEVIEKCLARLEGLKVFVADVLSWTAIESGQLNLEMRRLDLRPLLEQVVERYLDRAQEKRVELELELDAALPEVKATPERMMQVLENLVSNAVKYTLEGGRVSVVAHRSDGALRISVRDSGIGMSKEDQSHLFEGFFRASAVKRKFEGTGLGLSLVHGIVRAHHGKIWVESELGEGSTFHVELPLATGAAAVDATP